MPELTRSNETMADHTICRMPESTASYPMPGSRKSRHDGGDIGRYPMVRLAQLARERARAPRTDCTRDRRSKQR